MRRLLFVLWLAIAPLGVSGQVTSDSVLAKYMLGPISVRDSGGWNIGKTAEVASNRVWSSSGSGAAAKIIATDAIAMAGRYGPMTVSGVQAVGLSDAALAVARCLAGSGPVCAAGTVAATAYGIYRVYRSSEHSGSPQCNGSELCADPGASRETVAQYCFQHYNGWNTPAAPICDITVPGAASLWVAWANVQPGPIAVSKVFEVGSCSGVNCSFYWRQYGGAAVYFGNVNASTSSGLMCPASIDPLNPAYSVPPGSPVGPDGLCPKARYYHQPVTAAGAAAAVAAYPSADVNSTWKPALEAAIDDGEQTAPAKLSTSGPATQTGTPITETHTSPSGTTTTTTTPTATYNYAGDVVSYTVTNVTQTCVGAEACTTTSEEKPPPDERQDDPCNENPDRAGCVKLGTPTDSELGGDSITVAINPAGSFGPSTAACPAPRQVTLSSGLTVAFPFDMICDVAGMLRPVIVGMAYLSAIVGFLGLARRAES